MRLGVYLSHFDSIALASDASLILFLHSFTAVFYRYQVSSSNETALVKTQQHAIKHSDILIKLSSPKIFKWRRLQTWSRSRKHLLHTILCNLSSTHTMTHLINAYYKAISPALWPLPFNFILWTKFSTFSGLIKWNFCSLWSSWHEDRTRGSCGFSCRRKILSETQRFD